MNLLIKAACVAVIIDCSVGIYFRLKGMSVDKKNTQLYQDAMKQYEKAIQE